MVNENLAKAQADSECTDCEGSGVVVKNEEEDMYCHCTKDTREQDIAESRDDYFKFNNTMK